MCNIWNHRRTQRRVEDAREKLWRISNARMFLLDDSRRCTSGYPRLGVGRRRDKKSFRIT
jgi:hypothetical protein